ncbi:hypothetical protein DAETH_37350 (plasmid) [Deinococcus aetherius]|uniref:Uncharacterized protein n=1 Tax=Deinococcus aetherius TaxID=200252 RepID=A0ABM8AIY5_9DEIO|nr:hypothetical protein [Deinococcus aetherius]BDP43766.1 hypothetical protein DAETH_37350 [Deinococcus aetherius]
MTQAADLARTRRHQLTHDLALTARLMRADLRLLERMDRVRGQVSEATREAARNLQEFLERCRTVLREYDGLIEGLNTHP